VLWLVNLVFSIELGNINIFTMIIILWKNWVGQKNQKFIHNKNLKTCLKKKRSACVVSSLGINFRSFDFLGYKITHMGQKTSEHSRPIYRRINVQKKEDVIFREVRMISYFI